MTCGKCKDGREEPWPKGKKIIRCDCPAAGQRRGRVVGVLPETANPETWVSDCRIGDQTGCPPATAAAAMAKPTPKYPRQIGRASTKPRRNAAPGRAMSGVVGDMARGF